MSTVITGVLTFAYFAGIMSAQIHVYRENMYTKPVYILLKLGKPDIFIVTYGLVLTTIYKHVMNYNH